MDAPKFTPVDVEVYVDDTRVGRIVALTREVSPRYGWHVKVAPSDYREGIADTLAEAEQKTSAACMLSPELPFEVDIDGVVDAKGIRYIGKAMRQPDGTYISLANVGNALCRVEVTITLTPKPLTQV